SFLKSPPVAVDDTLDDLPLTEGPGTKIGRYKLLQLIGEGGFGVVYMAEQERPIRRKVALKIIKLGMDTRQVIARFEAERQALAMMDHPNIARVFDAGATDTGRPYFVMELVRGIPITEYCDKNNFDTRRRLELFIDVCKAVQHAHQKGIIHRDIKPTNVMITLHDGKPVPKIIDFGIAKATQHRLTEKTLFTEYQQFIGTPEYMSPEQAEMSGLDVDTRTDIYSLGVLLYQLLTGTTLFEGDQLRSAAYDEIRRIIRETEPATPSRRLSTLGDTLTDIAKRRHTEPAALRRLVRGDLDWIVMKTLEKDRTRRYETANELARDVERHLSDEPVVAGPPGTVYRLRKFVKRHRTGVTFCLSVAAVVVAGLIVSTVMYLWAEHARGKEATARSQAEQAERVSKEQRLRAVHLLARSQLERGVKLLNEGNCEGLLDLLDARIIADEIPELRDAASRLWAIAHDLWSDRLVHVVAGSSGLAFSPDGRLLATVDGSTARLWKTTTGRPHSPPLDLEKRIDAIVFSPDGKLLVTHSEEGVAQLWDAATGHPLGPPLRHEAGKRKWQDAYGWSAAFSPDGKLLATAGDDKTVRMWETKTGQPHGEPMRHGRQASAVTFSPDGKLLASGASDGTVQLWEVASGRPHGQPLHTKQWYVSKIAFSPDGKLLATTAYEAVYLWETEMGRLRAELPDPAWVKDMTFSPDGKLLATASTYGTAQLWDTTTGKPHGEPLRHGGRVMSVAFSPDGKLLATGSHDQTVQLWEIAGVQPYGQPLRHQARLRTVAFSPDGKFVAAGDKAGTTRIWRTHPQLHTEVVRHPTRLGSVISPDGKLEAVILDKAVQLRDTTTGKAYGPKLPHDAEVTAVGFSPDGKLLATGTDSPGDTGGCIWEVATGQTFTAPLKTGSVLALAFSPDGKLLAHGGRDWCARLFEVATGRQLPKLDCDEWIHGVAFSPDGKVLATATLAGTVCIWDVENGHQVGPALRHGQAVWDVAYSPDGSILAAASAYSPDLRVPARASGENAGPVVARLWEVSTGPPYQSLAVPAQKVDAKTALGLFSSDGALVLDKPTDGTMRVWRLPAAPPDLAEMRLQTWVAIGARRSNGEVTAIPWQEWQKLRDEFSNPSTGKKAAMTSGKAVVAEKNR
ncbi:MAG: protein kinase domain-containing protein, partial [Planctomycetota bacterium]